MSNREEKDIYIDTSGLKKGEKISYKYDKDGRISEVSKEDRCWVVTAYYGHPAHPHVCTIRSWRDDIIHNSPWGGVMQKANQQYQKLASTQIASYWRNAVKRPSLPHYMTRLLCAFLLRIAK